MREIGLGSIRGPRRSTLASGHFADFGPNHSLTASIRDEVALRSYFDRRIPSTGRIGITIFCIIQLDPALEAETAILGGIGAETLWKRSAERCEWTANAVDRLAPLRTYYNPFTARGADFAWRPRQQVVKLP